MLLMGFVLAVLITVGFIILFYKLPLAIRGWVARRYFLLDTFISWVTFATIGFSIMGLFAAAMIALFVSAYLWWYKRTKMQSDLEEVKRLRAQRGPIFIYTAAKLYNWWRDKKVDKLPTVGTST